MNRKKWLAIGLCIIPLIIALLILVYRPNPTSSSYFTRQLEDYRSSGEFRNITFYVYWSYFNTTQILNSTMGNLWDTSDLVVKVPLGNIPILVYNSLTMDVQCSFLTNSSGYLVMDAQDHYLHGDYYIKVPITVHFLEGGKETYFFWYFFSLNAFSEEFWMQNITLRHALWDEAFKT